MSKCCNHLNNDFRLTNSLVFPAAVFFRTPTRSIESFSTRTYVGTHWIQLTWISIQAYYILYACSRIGGRWASPAFSARCSQYFSFMLFYVFFLERGNKQQPNVSPPSFLFSSFTARESQRSPRTWKKKKVFFIQKYSLFVLMNLSLEPLGHLNLIYPLTQWWRSYHPFIYLLSCFKWITALLVASEWHQFKRSTKGQKSNKTKHLGCWMILHKRKKPRQSAENQPLVLNRRWNVKRDDGRHCLNNAKLAN